MILYEADWQRYPTAIIDYNTTNESFLRMAALYKKMGVKNHAFMLALTQPELQGLDPHSPDLTLDQKVMIGTECKRNPWYYFREVVRIPPVAGPTPIQFKANRGNMSMIWLFLCCIDLALIQPRQTGKSVSTDTVMVWLIYIGAGNTKINMITKDDTLRRANVERLKKIRDLLPKWLVPIRKDDSDNQYELTCKELFNTYTSGVSQNSESTANNLGRGLTAPITHIDEGPFINFIGTTLPAALASGTQARKEAEMYGRPYGNIFTTTAGKKDDRDGRFMYDMIHDAAVWQEAFLDAYHRNDLTDLIRKNMSGKKVMVNCTFSHRQLGLSDEWLYEAMANAKSTGEAADRDFLNVWTSGTQSSPLSTKLNEAIKRSEMEPLHLDISKEGYITRWYIPEDQIQERMATGQFVLGQDTSEAVGRDSIGFVLTDARDLSVVAAGTYNETNLIVFGHFIADFLIRYPSVTYIVEAKSSGRAIIDVLLQKLPAAGIDPFKRIYNTIVDRHMENPEEYREINTDLSRRPYNFYDRYRRHFGFMTTGYSRGELYSTVLQNAAKKAAHLVRDKVLSTEIRGLVVKKGRIDHAASGHDDMVISWLLSHWLLTQSRNLQHYGLTEALSDVADSSTGEITVSPEERYERQQQKQVMAEIEKTYEELRESSDMFVVAKLEHKLKALNARLKVDDSNVISIDALIRKASEERMQRSRNTQRNRLDGFDRGRALNWRRTG